MFHLAITIILDDRREVHLFDHLGIALLYHFEAFMLANHASKLMTASVPLYLLNDRREIDFLEYLGIALICTPDILLLGIHVCKLMDVCYGWRRGLL